MASAVSQASPFSPSPSSPLIPQPMSSVAHDTKRLSALLTPVSNSPTPAGEMTTGMYHNSQRNSSGTLSPSSPATMMKRHSGPPQGPTPSYDPQSATVSDSRSDVSSTSSRSSLTARSPVSPTTPTPIIIPVLASPAPSSSSSSPFVTPESGPDTTLLVSNPALTPSPVPSSPATSAFKTPASSFSDPPSPTRPVPPSPAVSRRASRLSLGQSTRSRRQSQLIIEVKHSPIEADPTLPSNTVTPTVSTEVSSTPTAAIIPAPESATVLTPTPPAPSSNEPLILVRDYAFPPTDDRFHGRGPFVPKFNRLERLNRVLAGLVYESDEDEANKQKEKQRKKKKRHINGWSDSDSDMDVDSSEGGFKGFGGFGISSSSSGGGGGGSGVGGGSGIGKPVVPTEHVIEDEEDEDRVVPSPSFGAGWGMLGFGMNWLPSNFSRDGGSGGGGGGGFLGRETTYPSQLEFERNFGQDGAEYEDMDADDDRDYVDPVDSPLAPGSYRALYAFEAVGETEMGLEVGQVVTIVGKGRGDGWAVVNDTREGKEGHALVPESYLELVELAE